MTVPAFFRRQAQPALAPIAVGLLHYPGVRCPSCGGRAFDVGRVTAECARCGGALLLTHSDPLNEAKGYTCAQ